MSTQKNDPLAAWAVLDLFGRQKAAGFLTEIKLGGAEFLRLHIPATNGQQARTIDFNPDAVYAAEYVDEETARMVATLHQPPAPVEAWSARRLIESGGSHWRASDAVLAGPLGEPLSSVPDAEIVDEDDPDQLDLDEEDPL